MSVRVLHFVAYGMLFGLMTKMSLRWWSERANSRRSKNRGRTGNSREIADVIFTNEQSFACLQNHVKITNSNSNSSMLLNLNSPNKSIEDTSAAVVAAAIDCSNPFCFSKNMKRLTNYIDQAKTSIDLAMYTFSVQELADAIERASHRGVNVRLISDKAMAKMLCSQLKKGIVDIRLNKDQMLMHHKFCIIDGVKRATALQVPENKIQHLNSLLLNGSLNWTKQGTGSNWENCVISSNQNLLLAFENEFQRMWDVFF